MHYADRKKDRRIEIKIDGLKDRRIEIKIDGLKDRWIERQMDRKIELQKIDRYLTLLCKDLFSARMIYLYLFNIIIAACNQKAFQAIVSPAQKRAYRG